MDVRISFGTDLESVPSRVIDILKSVNTAKVDQLISLAYELVELSSDHANMAEKLLDQARTELTSLDRALSDSQMILSGYANAKNPEKPAPSPKPTPTPEPTNAD